MQKTTRITIGLWTLATFFGVIFVLTPVVAVNAEPAAADQSFFKLLPTPTGSCPDRTGCCINGNAKIETAERGGQYTYSEKACVGEEGKCAGSGPGVGLPCNYSVCDFLQLFVNAMNIILSLFGGVALVLLIWGSIGFLTSGGSEERVTKSKELMKNTVMGIIVILGAWQLVATLIFLAVPKEHPLRKEGITGKGFALWGSRDSVRALCGQQEQTQAAADRI